MKKYFAFSLLELSVTLVVIGLVLAGVTQGTKVLNIAKLINAQALTKKSPVLDIEGLSLWYETTSAQSFLAGEAVNNGQISAWNDISPKVASAKFNATQATTANKPLFITNVFNGAVPAIKFDGTNDYLGFNGNFLIGSSYTIFIVEKRSQAAVNQYFMGGAIDTQNQNLHLGYRTNTQLTQAHYQNDLNVTITGVTSPQASVHSFWFRRGSGGGKKYWQNGGGNPKASSTGSSQEAPISDYVGAAVGKYWSANFFDGYLAEFIMFNRALENKERKLIEAYLGKKYNIAIDNASSATTGGIGVCSGACSCAAGYTEVSGSCQANCTVGIAGVNLTSVNAGASGNFTCGSGYTGSPSYSCSNGVLTAGSCCTTGYTMVSGICRANCAVSIAGVSTTSVNAGASGNFTCVSGYTGSPSYSCNNGVLTAGSCQANCAVSIAGVSTTSVSGGASGNFTCGSGYSGLPSYSCSNGVLTAGSCQANCAVSIAGVSTTSVSGGASGNFTCGSGYSGSPSYSCSNGVLTAGSCQANCAVSITGVSTTSVNAGASGSFTCSGGYSGSVSYSCTNGSLSTSGSCNVTQSGYDGCTYYSQSCICSNTRRNGNCSATGNYYGNGYLYCHCDGWY
jgi:hypothetical protein